MRSILSSSFPLSFYCTVFAASNASVMTSAFLPQPQQHLSSHWTGQVPMRSIHRSSIEHNIAGKKSCRRKWHHYASSKDDANDSLLASNMQSFRKAADEGFGTKAKNAALTCSVGDVIVPLVGNLTQRQVLANRGIYAGVEYEVCELIIPSINNIPAGQIDQDERRILSLKGLSSASKKGTIALVKPAYRLRENLERSDWPVAVTLDEIPLWLSKSTYMAGNALGTLALSTTFVFFAAIVAFFVRIVSVPTPSMLPALSPGSIVLVTRTIPIGPFKPQANDVVLFNAPPELESVAAEAEANINVGESSGQITSLKGKQFLKRVVAIPGDEVGVRKSELFVPLGNNRYRFFISGPYFTPELFPGSSWERPPIKLQKNEYFVSGDNGFRSVDSRVWGGLPAKYIVGTARCVIWPRPMPISDGPFEIITKQSE